MANVTRGVKTRKTKAAAPKVEEHKPTREEIAAAKERLEAVKADVNARIERANTGMHKAEDMLLSAAQVLKEAEDLCKTVGQPFKAWVAKNITQSWETARKYLAFAKTEDPVKALEDHRKAAAKRMKESRDRAKAAAEGRKIERPASAASEAPARTRQPTGIDALKMAFLALVAKDQIAFAKWAAGETGYSLVSNLAPQREPVSTGPVGKAAEDGSDLPEHLAAEGTKRRRRTAQSAGAAATEAVN